MLPTVRVKLSSDGLLQVLLDHKDRQVTLSILSVLRGRLVESCIVTLVSYPLYFSQFSKKLIYLRALGITGSIKHTSM